MVFERGDEIFVQIPRSTDDRVRIARVVEHLARPFGKIGEVAAVEANALRFMPLRTQDVEYLDRVGNAALQRIVCVDEQKARVRKELRIGEKRFVLCGEIHDPAVRMRTRHGNAEQFARQHVGSRAAAADDGSARTVHARIRALRAAQTEFHHRIPFGGVSDLSRLGGDQRLVVDDVQQRRFQKLRLAQRGAHGNDRLFRKYDRSLRHGIYVARKAKIF